MVLAVATALGGAGAFWHVSGVFPVDHPSFYSCVVAPLVVAVAALVAGFAPFDRPASAVLWAAPLGGAAAGVALAGLGLFLTSFVWLAPALLAYAVGVGLLGRWIAVRAPDGPTRLGLARVVLLLALGAGAGLAWLWAPPPGGARPLPLDASWTSAAPEPDGGGGPGRARRWTSALVLTDDRAEVQLSLRRPRVVVTLGGQTVIVEPCLYLEEATADGFFAVGPINTYGLEPGGPALADLADAPDASWLRAEYPSGRELHAVAGVAAPTSAISAEVEVRFDAETREVTIDAVTRLERPVTVRLASLGLVQLPRISRPKLHFGLAGGFGAEPPPGRWPEQAELLSWDGRAVRALRARRAFLGPYETLAQGEFEGWVSVSGGAERVLVVAPDWLRQASPRRARGAGHGLRENALVYWREGDTVDLLYDVASGRSGAAPLSTTLPAGVYRNRVVIVALEPLEHPQPRARRILRRLGLWEGGGDDGGPTGSAADGSTGD